MVAYTTVKKYFIKALKDKQNIKCVPMCPLVRIHMTIFCIQQLHQCSLIYASPGFLMVKNQLVFVITSLAIIIMGLFSVCAK